MSFSPAYECNLLIIHTPGLQDISDFLTIRNMMLGAAPGVRVLIVSLDKGITAETLRIVNERPTLVFSPAAVELPEGLRGTRLIPRPMTKAQEAKLLAEAGLPVPGTAHLASPEGIGGLAFGPLVVVKPNKGRQGRDVKLIRLADLDAYAAAASREGPLDLLVQEWIDTGPFPSCYRVMTVLGEVVYCVKSTALNRAGAQGGELPPGGVLVSANGQERSLACADDPDILELGRSVHRAFPDLPTMGIDIIRDVRTNRLHVLETNSRGLTWHLSSNYFRLNRLRFGLDLYNQFDALKTIQRALARAAASLAS